MVILQEDPVVYYLLHEDKLKIHTFYSNGCIVTLHTSLDPTDSSIYINYFKCDKDVGATKGDGKRLLCFVLRYMKKDATEPILVSLDPDPTMDDTVLRTYFELRRSNPEHPEIAEAYEQEMVVKLKSYYAKYGFQDAGQYMRAELDTILSRCASGGRRTRKKRRRRTARLFKSKA